MTLHSRRHHRAKPKARQPRARQAFQLCRLLESWFLGPSSSFRNGARTWIYLGFVGVFFCVIGLLSLLSPNG